MSSATILVVDRNRRFLEKTEEILREAGYRMHAALDSAQARELLRKHRPDVVIANPRIPGDPGGDLCHHVKAEIDATIPVVLLFSREDEGVTGFMRRSEAENYLVRPLKRHELLFCVRDMLLIRRLRREVVQLRAQGGRAAAAQVEEAPIFLPFDLFKRLLYLEIKRAKRYGLPLSALLLDLDRVDEVSRRHGSGVVEDLRLAVARAIRRSIRALDIPVSFERGKILIVMPHTDEAGARVVAERILARLHRSAFRGDGFVLRPTLSIGATTSASGRSVSFREMILGATLALREAQRAGGDQVVFA